ncbi:hypothetical protein BDN67DRAFT_694896 [Paxillus ammoniavirescens]|nr:hypothetical protein BDN67DRAFT_694896 [Paxillus ammoniavirescens]
MAVNNCFIRGSVVRYVQLPACLRSMLTRYCLLHEEVSGLLCRLFRTSDTILQSAFRGRKSSQAMIYRRIVPSIHSHDGNSHSYFKAQVMYSLVVKCLLYRHGPPWLHRQRTTAANPERINIGVMFDASSTTCLFNLHLFTSTRITFFSVTIRTTFSLV